MFRYKKYELEDVVWAKVEGHPHWPATIANIKESERKEKVYTVNFIRERSHANLTAAKLAPFKEAFDYYSRKATKALKKAIATAVEIVNGKTTHEKESCKLLAQRQALAQKAAQTMKRLRAEGRTSLEPVVKEKKEKAVDTFIAEKTHLKDLLACTDPKKILAGKRSVERFLNTISIENTKTWEKIMESKLGKALKEFYTEAKDIPELKSLKEEIGKKIEELKTGITLQMFGVDESCKMIDLVRESSEERMSVSDSSESNRIPSKKFEGKRLKKNSKLAEKNFKNHSNSEDNDRLDVAFNPDIKLRSFAKDTHLMIEVCEELTQLLNKVIILMTYSSLL
jgi:hypothetical protein